MLPSARARLTLSIALALLCFSGIAAAFTIDRLYVNETWVRHTYDVEVAIAEVESALSNVGRRRAAYIDSTTPDSLQAFNAAVTAVPATLAKLQQLITDNPSEQALAQRLESSASSRVAPSVASVQLAQQGRRDTAMQLQLTSNVAKAALETAAITEEMGDNEDRLLAQRSRLSTLLFAVTLSILVVSFAPSAFVFWLHNRLLNRELRNRRSAEDRLHELSGQLMRVQDNERRRLSRELHDGLGQNLVAAKMTAEALLATNRQNSQIGELVIQLDESLLQTRSISYLLHPPLLDDIGVTSAAKWFIEGYAKRTGTQVSADFPEPAERLPPDLELTIFRILQEALTNIHRHSRSAKVDVFMVVGSGEVTLSIRDYGIGIPEQTLAHLDAAGTSGGVGLAGIVERVRDFGGKMDIRSKSPGTEIAVQIPISPSTSPKPS